MKTAATEAELHRLAELGLSTAGLIHELRQPVFALRSLLQLAQLGGPGVAESLPLLLQQIDTLEQLLAGYADYSRKPAVAPELLSLGQPAASAQIILERRARAAGVRLVVEVQPEHLAVAPRLAIQQALVNLGQNAIDAVRGQPGGCVEIRSFEEGAEVGLRVADNGPGLPPSILAHLFEPFHTTKPDGTGLGLALTREILARGGGQLLLRAGPHTCWEIRLPTAVQVG